MSVKENKNRIGAISSSKAHLLMAKGTGKKDFSVACYTYLDGLKRERRFGKSLDEDFYSRPTSWGNMMEKYVSDNKISFEFKHIGDTTFNHQQVNGWVGTPDFIGADTVAELKCYYPDKFTSYAECLELESVEDLKKNFKAEYWQIVSNTCVLDLEYGAACLFMPKQDDIMNVAKYVEDYDGSDAWKYRFIHEEIVADPDNPSIPFIPTESTYKDFYFFKFKIPQEDKEILTERIKLGIDYING